MPGNPRFSLRITNQLTLRRLRLTWALFFLAALFLGEGRAAAQNEYVVSLNEQTLSLNRVAHVPGVTWVENNINTFDQNRRRYFFFGNANNIFPFFLYTVPVTGGTVQPGVFCTATGCPGRGICVDDRISLEDV